MVRTALVLSALCLGSVAAAAQESSEPRRMQATAYCQTGLTSSGLPVRSGFIAADPHVLKQGTLVQVEAPKTGYSGVYEVQDTGAAVKGHIIDIFIPDCRAAKRFGRRRVTVRVLAVTSTPSIATR